MSAHALLAPLKQTYQRLQDHAEHRKFLLTLPRLSSGEISRLNSELDDIRSRMRVLKIEMLQLNSSPDIESVLTSAQDPEKSAA